MFESRRGYKLKGMGSSLNCWSEVLRRDSCGGILSRVQKSEFAKTMLAYPLDSDLERAGILFACKQVLSKPNQKEMLTG